MLKTTFLGEISNNWPKCLLGTSLYKTFESYWQLLFVTLQWTNTSSVVSKRDTFSPFSFLVILPLVLPSNFIISGIWISWKYSVLILNAILFSIVFTYIVIEGLLLSLIFPLCSFNIYSKHSWLSNTEYDPSGNSNSPSHKLELIF